MLKHFTLPQKKQEVMRQYHFNLQARHNCHIQVFLTEVEVHYLQRALCYLGHFTES